MQYAGGGMRTSIRATTGQIFVGHWVQIRNVADRGSGNQMLETLREGGLADAYLVETEEEGLKISLGLFGELARAERIELQAKSLGLPADSWAGMPLLLMGVAGILINTILMVLNLLPLPPLDGGRILTGILPLALARVFARIEPFGMIILIGLLISGVIGLILSPVIFGSIDLLPGSTLVLGILPTLFP